MILDRMSGFINRMHPDGLWQSEDGSKAFACSVIIGVSVTDDIRFWLSENVQCYLTWSHNVLFEDAHDADLFTLKFS